VTMPDVNITNETPYTLNIALSQIAPLHFSNQVAPGGLFKTHTGSVWFTVEWRIDNVPEATLRLDSKALKKAIRQSNRYSASKSARTIAIVSVAGLSLVALAGPAALSAAAAAGSTTAAALLGSSTALQALSTAEVLAFSSYAATTLTASALEAITEDTGVSPEKSAKVQTSLNALTTAVAASSVAGAAALKGPKKAVMSAGTTLISKIAARSAKDSAEATKAARDHLLPAGKTERVYGVFIGFRERHFAIREVKGGKGESHMELWDTDANKRLV